MKVLLTGAAGQLGQALRQQVPEGIELIATSRSGESATGLLPLYLADAAPCRAAVLEHRPDWVLNVGAYTAVDRAENEPELALAVNGGAPRAFADALADTGSRLLQVSTDFVFNDQQGSPYWSEQSRDPLGAYGRTKAACEGAVEQVLGGSSRGVILRNSWVMGPVGKNFALTMLRLHRERGGSGQALGVVEDQVGCPTSTATLAAACWRAIAVITAATPISAPVPSPIPCAAGRCPSPAVPTHAPMGTGGGNRIWNMPPSYCSRWRRGGWRWPPIPRQRGWIPAGIRQCWRGIGSSFRGRPLGRAIGPGWRSCGASGRSWRGG